jgi:chemotaxis protein histidine kinase CheA
MSAAKILEPDRRLQRRVQGRLQDRLTPGLIERVNTSLEAVLRNIRPRVLEELAIIDDLARTRPINVAGEIYARCHVIRGIAGTCGLDALGRAAAIMCQLLDGLEDGAQVDADLLTTIAVTMMHASRGKPGEEALLEELIEACRDAVKQARPELF